MCGGKLPSWSWARRGGKQAALGFARTRRTGCRLGNLGEVSPDKGEGSGACTKCSPLVGAHGCGCSTPEHSPLTEGLPRGKEPQPSYSIQPPPSAPRWLLLAWAGDEDGVHRWPRSYSQLVLRAQRQPDELVLRGARNADEAGRWWSRWRQKLVGGAKRSRRVELGAPSAVQLLVSPKTKVRARATLRTFF